MCIRDRSIATAIDANSVNEQFPDDQREVTFSLFETEVTVLLAIAVNSQYSNTKNRFLRQQIEIWIATCSEHTAKQNTNIAWQYCKAARKRTTGLYRKAWLVVIFGINTTSDISKLLYVISRAIRRVKFETILIYHEWYLCQISVSYTHLTLPTKRIV